MSQLSAKGVVATILLGDAYRIWKLERLRLTTKILCGLQAMALIGLWTAMDKPNRVLVFQVDALQKIRQSYPLDAPNMDDAKLLAWASDAITRVNTYDFMNYRQQWQANKIYMTEGGFISFEEGLKRALPIDEFLSRGMFTVTAVPAGPPVLTAQGRIPVPGVSGAYRYVWRVKMPVTITHQSSTTKSVKRHVVEVEIGRVSEQGSQGMGVGIRQMVVM
jgi:hypothetical protein